MRFVIVFCIVFVFHFSTFSQSNWKVNIMNKYDSIPEQLKMIIDGKFTNVFECQSSLSVLINELVIDGYASVSLDSIEVKDSSINIWLFLGEKYYIKDVDIEIDSSHSYSNTSNFGFPKALNINNIRMVQNRILSDLEKNGYPFGKIVFKNISIQNQFLKAKIQIIQGTRLLIDTIINQGDLKISSQVLYHILGVNNGDIYIKSEVEKEVKKIVKTDFISVVKGHSIEIVDGKVIIYLYLNKRTVNSFDGILGLLNNPAYDNKISFTGNLSMHLKNSFNNAEDLKLDWSSTEIKTQKLNLNFKLPYLNKIPFGIAYELDFYKKDTSFVKIRNIPGFLLVWNGSNSIKVFADFENLSQINFPPIQIGKKYQNFNFNSKLFGFQIVINQSDNMIVPNNGYIFDLNLAVGKKTIEKSAGLDEKVFDGINMETTKSYLMSDIQWFHKFFNYPVLKLQAKSGFLQDENLMGSELFRLGGFKTLRGFDDESILVSSYFIGEIEIRFPLEQYSFLFLFFDKCVIRKELSNELLNDRPYSFGGGLSIQTKIGMFSIAYSLGSQYNQAIQFKSSKIHFGYTTRF